jgi:hypothetical protein
MKGNMKPKTLADELMLPRTASKYSIINPTEA